MCVEEEEKEEKEQIRRGGDPNFADNNLSHPGFWGRDRGGEERVNGMQDG